MFFSQLVFWIFMIFYPSKRNIRISVNQRKVKFYEQTECRLCYIMMAIYNGICQFKRRYAAQNKIIQSIRVKYQRFQRKHQNRKWNILKFILCCSSLKTGWLNPCHQNSFSSCWFHAILVAFWTEFQYALMIVHNALCTIRCAQGKAV